MRESLLSTDSEGSTCIFPRRSEDRQLLKSPSSQENIGTWTLADCIAESMAIVSADHQLKKSVCFSCFGVSSEGAGQPHCLVTLGASGSMFLPHVPMPGLPIFCRSAHALDSGLLQAPAGALFLPQAASEHAAPLFIIHLPQNLMLSPPKDYATSCGKSVIAVGLRKHGANSGSFHLPDIAHTTEGGFSSPCDCIPIGLYSSFCINSSEYIQLSCKIRDRDWMSPTNETLH